MTSLAHGISLGIESHDEQIHLYFKAVGKLTHNDFDIMVPMLESTLGEVREPRVKALFDCTEFKGWELQAAWDDFKLGLRHGNAFAKIAIFGDKPWHKTVSKVANWFTSGKVQYFENVTEARAWLKADGEY
ncbi:MAG: STAS/SEC14 domain-containing protein [Aestuariibacter sp.]